MSDFSLVKWLRKRWLGLVLGPLGFAAVGLLPSNLHEVPGMGDRPAWAAGVALWMMVWWFTEPVPIALTACLPLVLFPPLGVLGGGGLVGDIARTAEPFTDAYIFLFAGGMVLGAAMEEWGLHRRVALHVMLRVGTAPRRLLLGMLVATSGVSLWISNTATAVMMLPIALAILTELRARSGRELDGFGTALLLAVAYGANVGGIGTKIGTPVNSIFAGFLSDKLGQDLSFIQYASAALPFVALLVPLCWWILWRVARRDAPDTENGRVVIERELSALGALSPQERWVALVFSGAALLWVFGDPLRASLAPVLREAVGVRLLGKHYEASVAMLAALVLVAGRTAGLRTLRRVPVGTLVLLGGSFAMAAGIEKSGLASWMGLRLAPVAQWPLGVQLLVVSATTVGLSAVASNTATINLMLNILPRATPLLLASTLAASCDFALPAGTPPNAIVFGSGRIRLAEMMRIGVLLDLLCVVLITLYTWIYARHVLP